MAYPEVGRGRAPQKVRPNQGSLGQQKKRLIKFFVPRIVLFERVVFFIRKRTSYITV